MKQEELTTEQKSEKIVDFFLDKVSFEIGDAAISLMANVKEDYDLDLIGEENINLNEDTKYVYYNGDFYGQLTSMTSYDILTNCLIDLILDKYEDIHNQVAGMKNIEIIDFLYDYINKPRTKKTNENTTKSQDNKLKRYCITYTLNNDNLYTCLVDAKNAKSAVKKLEGLTKTDVNILYISNFKFF